MNLTPLGTIRAHILGIVLLGAILPLSLVGLWLIRSSIRSGESLLAGQIDTSLANVQRLVARRWEERQGGMLLLAENEVSRAALSAGQLSHGDSQYLAQAAAAFAPGIRRFSYHDTSGRVLYVWPAPTQQGRGVGQSARAEAQRTLSIQYPIASGATRVGAVNVEIDLATILPPDSLRLAPPGGRLAVRERKTGNVLLPLMPRQPYPGGESFDLDGKRWIARMDTIAGAPFELGVAAPVARYVTPFEQHGQRGIIALAIVTILALSASMLLTARLSRSVGALADAADAVALGDLSRHAPEQGPTELRRLAASFNKMTDSLRALVAELSHRRALAAVGEFAASLSHEVRNALTSMQIDLERAGERMEDGKSRALVARTLVHMRGLDAAVTGALRLARSGTVAAADTNLSAVLRDVVGAVETPYATAGMRLVTVPLDEEPIVAGDSDALRQLFLNLLLNAQQAMMAGGQATVSMRRINGSVIVIIEDTGRGMTSAQAARAFEPYYTTRHDGTGLGLPIARQIAIAHGGEITIGDVGGEGTTVEVTLPLKR